MSCEKQIGNVVLGVVAVTAICYLLIYIKLVQIVRQKYPNY